MPGGKARSNVGKAREKRRGIAVDLAATPLGRAFWLIWAICVLWTACFDPFGLDSRVESTAQSVTQRLLASRYPSAVGRDIVLIEVTAADLGNESLQLSLPLSPEVLAQLVRVLTAARIRAVFIDSEFHNPGRQPRDTADDLFNDTSDADQPSSYDTLAEAALAARQSGIPVLTGPIAEREDTARLRSAVTPTEVSWDADHLGDYALRNEAGETAAAAIYRIACTAPRPLQGCAPDLLHRIDRGAARPMALRFGGDYPAEQWRFSGHEEAAACRKRGALSTLRRELAGADPAPACTHHLVIPASWLLLAQNHFDELAAMLKGRVVLIGAGPGMNDDHIVPGVGRIPGVALHAMALDNLLSWGTAYPRWPEDFTDTLKIGPDELLKLFVLLVFPWILARAAAHICTGQKREAAIALRTAAVALAGATVLIAIALLCVPLFAWPASVALAVAGMSTIAINLLSGPDFHHALQPLAGRRGAAALLGTCALGVLLLIAPELLIVSLVLAVLGATIAGILFLAHRLRARAAQLPAPPAERTENAT